jgi:hypothetical protein
MLSIARRHLSTRSKDAGRITGRLQSIDSISKKGGLFLLRAGQVEPLREQTSSSEGDAIESHPYLRWVKCNYTEYRREYRRESGSKSSLPEVKKEIHD